ncbi:MAG: hypothetical protein NTU41_03895, partial [Chloroflexi bacterium]|nr:hypothetical protein [Chloroflexota bacterium]
MHKEEVNCALPGHRQTNDGVETRQMGSVQAMTEQKRLESVLSRLSKEVVETVREHVDSRRAVITKNIYISAKVTKLDYKEGGISSSISYPNLIREEWSLRDKLDLIQGVVKPLPAYKEATSEISQKYGVTEAQADWWLFCFVQSVVDGGPRPSEGHALTDDVSAFIADLEKNPVEWRLKAWVDGVWLQESEYHIHDRLKIRRPSPSDFEFETPLAMASELSRQMPEKMPGAIIELTARSVYGHEVTDELEAILTALRLFKVGSVFALRTENRPKSVLRGAKWGQGTIATHTAAYTYHINERDIPRLRVMIEGVGALWPIIRPEAESRT